MEFSTATRPFDRMTDSFGLNVRQGKTWGRQFLPLSAGVNWISPSPAVKQLLWHELTDGLTIRNYGNPGGSTPVVAALELPERWLHANRAIKVTLTHGTTEGAYLILDLWSRTGLVRPGDMMLAPGYAFGLYDRLAGDFGLTYRQVLGAADCSDSFMPDAERIAAALEDGKPRVIVMLLPNNPLGEFISEAGLREICRYSWRTGACLLIDRVCLMPWDDHEHIARALAPLIEAGHAAVVDSLSKSESLAGLRVGFVVTDAKTKAAIVERIKSRYLNPPVFGTAALAALRIAQFDLRRGARMGRLFERAADEIFSEYPDEEDFRSFLSMAASLMPALRDGTDQRRNTLTRNYESLQAAFDGRLARPLIWQGGFNVALSTIDMAKTREVEDSHVLACDRGVGVLTSRCFCEADDSDLYFIRIGLTLSPSDFAEGMSRLASFYKRPTTIQGI